MRVKDGVSIEDQLRNQSELLNGQRKRLFFLQNNPKYLFSVRTKRSRFYIRSRFCISAFAPKKEQMTPFVCMV